MSAVWQQVSRINSIKTAIWERLYAGPGGDARPGATYTPIPDLDNLITAGQIVQRASLWSTFQVGVEELAAQQKFFKTDYDPAGQHAITVPGYPAGGPPYTQPNPSYTPDLFIREIADIFTIVGIGGWMRKKPREISSLTQTYDNDGNLAEDGMTAWGIGVAAHTIPFTYFPRHRFVDSMATYRWNGTTWAFLSGDPVDSERADIVYTDRPEPRVVASTAMSVAKDYWGNTATVGMTAFQRTITVPTTIYDQRKLYVFNGTAWELDTEDPGGLPDLLVGQTGVESTISSLSVTYDDNHHPNPLDNQGHHLSDGARARYTGDGHVYQLVVSSEGGGTYDRTINDITDPGEAGGRAILIGSGGDVYRYNDSVPQWEEDAGGGPADTMYYDLYEWSGDYASDEDKGDFYLTGGYGCFFGACQVGDYLGDWIIEDIEACIRAFGKKTLISMVGHGEYAKSTNTVYPGETDNSVSIIEGRYGASGYSITGTAADEGPFGYEVTATRRGYINGTPPPDHYTDRLFGAIGSVSNGRPRFAANAHRARTAKAYGIMSDPYAGYSNTSTFTWHYTGAQAADTYALFGSASLPVNTYAAAGSIVPNLPLPSFPSMPTAPTAPDVSSFEGSGWFIHAFFAIAEWSFTDLT